MHSIHEINNQPLSTHLLLGTAKDKTWGLGVAHSRREESDPGPISVIKEQFSFEGLMPLKCKIVETKEFWV